MPSDAPISQCGLTPSRRARRAPLAHDDVVRLVAPGHRRERDVRESRAASRSSVLLRRRQLVLEPRDLVAERASLGDQLVRVFLGALSPSDFLRVGVPRRLSLFDRLDQRAAITLELDAAVDDRREAVERAAAAEPIAQQIDLLAEHPSVVHALVLGHAVGKRHEAAVRIDGEHDLHRARHGIHRGHDDLGVQVLARDRQPARRDGRSIARRSSRWPRRSSVVSARYPLFGADIKLSNDPCDTCRPTACVGASAEAIVRSGMNNDVPRAVDVERDVEGEAGRSPTRAALWRSAAQSERRAARR